jgi:hypothetical protein
MVPFCATSDGALSRWSRSREAVRTPPPRPRSAVDLVADSLQRERVVRIVVRPSPRVLLVTLVLAVAGLTGCGSRVKGEGCPDSAPDVGSACSTVDECSYPACSSMVTYTCSNGAWQLLPGMCGSPQPPDCPYSTPESGTPCPKVSPVGCSYITSPACGALRTDAYCVASADGPVWEVGGQVCLSHCSVLATSGDCEATEGCRWLEPGCGAGTDVVATQGCYLAADCEPGETDLCGPGTTCTGVVADPCWSGSCDACSSLAYVCQ